MSGDLIYWITRLDAFNSLTTGLIALGYALAFFGALIFCLCVTDGNREWTKETQKWYTNQADLAKKVTIICLVVSTALIMVKPFIPTTKEAAAIYLIPKISNNEDISVLGDKGVKALNEYLDRYIEDLQK